MKVLIVCSGNFPDPDKNFSIYQAFIHDQIKSLGSYSCEFKLFLIQGKGFLGYLKNFARLKRYIKANNIELIHAHSGMSALLASFIINKPLIVTFHGSDINTLQGNIISIVPRLMSKWNFFVSNKLQEKAIFKTKSKASIVPCGVDFNLFQPINKQLAKRKLGILGNNKIVVFASNFENAVKNFPLAKKALEGLNEPVEILEIKKRTREEVVWMLNAADILLLTSISEGSPQIVKEAMACNCPIVATNVGDINEVIANTEGCYITSFYSDEIGFKIIEALNFNKRTAGREKIKHFDNKIIASKIFDIYKQVYTYYYFNK